MKTSVFEDKKLQYFDYRLTREIAIDCTCRSSSLKDSNVKIYTLDGENDSPPMIEEQNKMRKELEQMGVEVKSKV